MLLSQDFMLLMPTNQTASQSTAGSGANALASEKKPFPIVPIGDDFAQGRQQGNQVSHKAMKGAAADPALATVASDARESAFAMDLHAFMLLPENTASDLGKSTAPSGQELQTENPGHSVALTFGDSTLSLRAEWSVEELLQFSAQNTAGGKALPQADQSLPFTPGHVHQAQTPAPLDVQHGANKTDLPATDESVRVERQNIASPGPISLIPVGGLPSIPGTQSADQATTASALTTSGIALAEITSETEADVSDVPPKGRSVDSATASILLAGSEQTRTPGAIQPALISDPVVAKKSDGNATFARGDTARAPAADTWAGSLMGNMNQPEERGSPGRPLLAPIFPGLQISAFVLANDSSSDSSALNNAASALPSGPQGVSSQLQSAQLIAELVGSRHGVANLPTSADTAARSDGSLPRLTAEAPFGNQAWSDTIGRQLLVMSSKGISAAQIRLDPPELGSLLVRIQVSADQQTSVSFVSPHAQVREALELQSARLHDLFREQGINLADVSVSDHTTRHEGDSSGQQRQHRDGDEGADEGENPVFVASARAQALIDFYV